MIRLAPPLIETSYGVVVRLVLFVQKISNAPKLLSDRSENHVSVPAPGGNAGHMSAEDVLTRGPRFTAGAHVFGPSCSALYRSNPPKPPGRFDVKYTTPLASCVKWNSFAAVLMFGP